MKFTVLQESVLVNGEMFHNGLNLLHISHLNDMSKYIVAHYLFALKPATLFPVAPGALTQDLIFFFFFFGVQVYGSCLP